MALLANGSVTNWGYYFNTTNYYSVINYNYVKRPPPSNVVAVAAGDSHNLALKTNGTVVAWGLNTSGQTNVPAGLSNVMAIAAGAAHSVALLNTNDVVEWGDNANGQVTIPSELPTVELLSTAPHITYRTNPPVVVKLIAAGGNHTMASIFSPLVQYPVNVSKDLLLIYNTNSVDSSNVCHYYLTHRPMVSNANVLGIGCTTNDPITPSEFTTNFQPQVQTWLTNNPAKRPQYVILFQSIPQEVDLDTTNEDQQPGNPYYSVQYQLHYSTAPGWTPFVTAINMNGRVVTSTNFNSSDGTNDCIAYINKLTHFASNSGQLFISASAKGYNNTNWYFDWANPPFPVTNISFAIYASNAAYGVTNVDPGASVIGTVATNYNALATNVAGYYTVGWDGGIGNSNIFVNGTIKFFGQSGWYIMNTIQSIDGQRTTFQASYLTCFASNAFWGTNYSNTPVGAVTTVEEPTLEGKVAPDVYYGEWAAGKSFSISAWAAQEQGYGYPGFYFQAVGDPFVRK